MKCIFCMEEKEDNEFTIEHIFPDAIGGSLTNKNVCKHCNDYLGRKVDCLLTNHWIVQGNRQLYKIAGKTGVIPNPIGKGFLNGEKDSVMQYRFTKEGVPERVYISPDLKTKKIDGHFQIELKLDKSEANEALKIINKTLKRNGYEQLSSDKFEATVQREEVSLQKPVMELEAEIDIYKYKRAIFKIIYELACNWLGNQYLEDEIAIVLRKVILDDALWVTNDWSAIGLEGNIDFYSPTENIWKFWEDNKIFHLAFNKIIDGKMVISVRIFNVFSATIVVTNSAYKYFPVKEYFISIDPETRKLMESTFDEVISKFALQLR